MNDKEFFKKHPNVSYSEFAMWAWHEKFHGEPKNPNCDWCNE